MSDTDKSDNVLGQLGITGPGGNQTVVLICNIPNGNGNGNILRPLGQVTQSMVPIKYDTDKKLLSSQEKGKRLLEQQEQRERKMEEKLTKELEKKKKQEERRKQREKEEQEKKERKEKRDNERKRKQEEIAEKQELKRKIEMKKKEKEMLEEEKKKRNTNRFKGFFLSSTPNKENESMDTSIMLPRQPLCCKELDMKLQEQNYNSVYLSLCKRVDRKEYKKKNKMKCILLQFTENHRPPYWGTWNRQSHTIRPRAPFNKDIELLNYSIDSDEEWEEEEPGESLTDSEIDDDCGGGAGGSHSNDEEEDDGFFVPHGYLSDDEGNISDHKDECNREQKQLAKVDAWETQYTRKCQQLVPKYIGIITNELKEELVKYCCVLMDTTPINCTQQQQDTTSQQNNNAVPLTAMPDLIRHIHKNSMGLKRLVDTFRDYWSVNSNRPVKQGHTLSITDNDILNHPSGISKRQVELKILSIATKDNRHGNSKLWYVNEEVIKQHGLIESQLTPLSIMESSPDKSKQHITPKGMKDIKHFFKTPNNKRTADDTIQGVSPVRGVSITPPVKKRRVALTPILVIDDKEENIKMETSKTTDNGIDWCKTLKERNKISVSIDIHI